MQQNLRTVPPADFPGPGIPPKQTLKGVSISIELTGYEKIKEELNDIEQQLDRINEKQKKIIT